MSDEALEQALTRFGLSSGQLGGMAERCIKLRDIMKQIEEHLTNTLGEWTPEVLVENGTHRLGILVRNQCAEIYIYKKSPETDQFVQRRLRSSSMHTEAAPLILPLLQAIHDTLTKVEASLAMLDPPSQ